MQPTNVSRRKIEPERLGLLGERSLVEMSPGSTSEELFPGASLFLTERRQRRRTPLWEAAGPTLDRLLGPEERVLYVAEAMHVPPFLQAISLGYLTYYYHQVLLVLTNDRLIELLLSFRGKRPASRVRSYTWRDTGDLRLRLRRMTLTPARGKKQAWVLPVRGDRKLLGLLLPRLRERLCREGSTATASLPLWHCPLCGAASEARPSGCAACNTRFRSPHLAFWLSLAFPGAGLLYAGHPFLAALDFLGELFLFAIVAVGLATSSSPEQSFGFGFMGALLFVGTKFESFHVGHTLITRTKPETERQRGGFMRLAIVGTFLSTLAISGALVATGRLQPVVDRDLDLLATSDAWSVSRQPEEWSYFADDTSARSQWTHDSGMLVTLFAYPLKDPAEVEEFRKGFRETIRTGGQRIILEDQELPGPFQGFRNLAELMEDGGEPVTSINYFIYDPEGMDIHQIFTAVPSSFSEEAVDLLAELLSGARWIDAASPASRSGSGEERPQPH